MNKCEPYYIVLCSACGSFGSHRKCGNIKGADVDKWLCITCKNVLEKSLPSPSTSYMTLKESSTPTSSLSSNLSSSLSNVSTNVSSPLSNNGISTPSTTSQSEPSENGATNPSKVSRLESVKRQGTKKARSESPEPRSKVRADRI